jgi:hypothetical protein
MNDCISTTTSEYIYLILVNGNISSDGYFEEEELEEAKRIKKKYELYYDAELKRIKKYRTDLT